jgi:hypothetical protein
MDEGREKQSNLIDTTDCLEAIGVFRGWKNFLFIITICCLLLLQVSFWLVNTGYVKAGDDTKSDTPAVVDEDTKQINEAAKQVTAEPNQPTEAAAQQQKTSPLFGIKFKQLSWLIRFVNFVLIPAAILYCLTMLFSLKISLLGRLGGINHISRAFFLSLLMLVLLLPWQRFFAGVVFGAIYTPGELLTSCTAETRSIFGTVYHYYRFTGHWLLVVLLLIFAQLRSSRWAKATIRRLEVI